MSYFISKYRHLQLTFLSLSVSYYFDQSLVVTIKTDRGHEEIDGLFAHAGIRFLSLISPVTGHVPCPTRYLMRSLNPLEPLDTYPDPSELSFPGILSVSSIKGLYCYAVEE